MKVLERSFYILIIGACTICVLMSVVGGVLHFSPVPYWDMWDAYLNFFIRFSSGDWSAIWEQHNEHRIVVARILFFLDIAFFGGRGVSLIFLNYFCVLCSVLIFNFILSQKLSNTENKMTRLVAFSIVSAWLFAWTQWENFTWAFQTQFFLAQLLPLAALTSLAHYKISPNGSKKWYWVALVLGVVSCFTLMNGLLCLPALLFAALFLRMRTNEVVVIGLASILCLGLYFYGFESPQRGVGMLEALISDFPSVLRYTTIYLGSPFGLIIGGGNARIFAEFLGLLFLVVSAIFAVKILLGRTDQPLDVLLTVFIGFIVVTAFVTAIGRFDLGMDTATSSRYTTPALMGWASLFCLSLDKILNRSSFGSFISLCNASLVLAICIVVLNFQRAALNPNTDLLHSRQVAALAIELGFSDEQVSQFIFPDADAVLEFGRRASAIDISIFGSNSHKDIAEEIGQEFPKPASFVCPGSVDSLGEVKGSREFLRIVGWQYDAITRRGAGSVFITDEDGIIIGYALSGMPRRDVAEVLGDKRAVVSGFMGYLDASFAGGKVVLRSRELGCETKIQLPY